VVDLGALVPGQSSTAYTINNSGSVVGVIGAWPNLQAVAWINATTKPQLVLLGGRGQNSAAYSVNDAGISVGEINPTGVQQAIQFPATRLDTAAGTPPTVFSMAYNSNANGVVAGVAGLSGDPNPHAVVYNHGSGPIDLGNFGTDVAVAYDIKGADTIVGTAATARGPSHAFVHNGISRLNQATDDIGTLGGLQSEANCVNLAKEVAGWSDLLCRSSTAVRHIFLWQSGKMRDLGSPFPRLPATMTTPFGRRATVRAVELLTRVPDSSHDGGECINMRGSDTKESAPLPPQIVGYAMLYENRFGGSATCLGFGGNTSFNRAVFFDGTMMHDLNDMIPPTSGWYLEQAFGINNASQIVGVGRFAGEEHAFLLMP
jgi:probable HAF family extracellular repeat protein